MKVQRPLVLGERARRLLSVAVLTWTGVGTPMRVRTEEVRVRVVGRVRSRVLAAEAVGVDKDGRSGRTRRPRMDVLLEEALESVGHIDHLGEGEGRG